MGFVHTLDQFAPVPRLDGQPFTTMQLEESADRVTFAVIASQALTPLDADPRYPAVRGITSDQGTMERCWLRITFLDAQGDMSRSDWVWSRASPTGLASVLDVRAALRLRDETAANDDDLAHSLAVAASWLQDKVPGYGVANGTINEFNVSTDAVIRLPVRSATVSQVRAWYADTATPTVLTAGTDYLVIEGGVRLFGGRSTGLDPRYGPDDVARTFARVDVSWSAADPVPDALREGVALFAAGLWATNPKLTSGMRSETIGSYSYTLSDKDVEDVMPSRARALLKPYMRRKLPFVV